MGRELSVSLDKTADATQRIDDLTQQFGNGGVLTLKDEHGRTIIVPTERIAYIEVRPEPTRSVGFGDI